MSNQLPMILQPRIGVEVSIGDYVIRPHPTLDGRVFVEVQRVEEVGIQGEVYGATKTIDLDELFKDEPRRT